MLAELTPILNVAKLNVISQSLRRRLRQNWKQRSVRSYEPIKPRVREIKVIYSLVIVCLPSKRLRI
jgi:hypothetical protein